MPAPGPCVAVLGCRRTETSPADDLYPDPDAAPLTSALVALGARVRLLSWDAEGCDWDAFDHLVVSSTWDSVDRPGEYLEWASARPRLVNPYPVVRWGLDKGHQAGLASAGIPVIPTEWVSVADTWSPPDFEFVVKPAVSAGGRSTARYPRGSVSAGEHVASLVAAGQVVMVQPYLPSIDRLGEVDLVYIGGRYSHAVGKLPGLPPGRGIIERPWEQMAWSGPVAATPAQLEVGKAVVEHITSSVGRAAYARVDLLASDAGPPILLEVEVVDPFLSLDSHPEAAQRLAELVLNDS